jgi:hypothetical protein
MIPEALPEAMVEAGRDVGHSAAIRHPDHPLAPRPAVSTSRCLQRLSQRSDRRSRVDRQPAPGPEEHEHSDRRFSTLLHSRRAGVVNRVADVLRRRARDGHADRARVNGRTPGRGPHGEGESGFVGPVHCGSERNPHSRRGKLEPLAGAPGDDGPEAGASGVLRAPNAPTTGRTASLGLPALQGCTCDRDPGGADARTGLGTISNSGRREAPLATRHADWRRFRPTPGRSDRLDSTRKPRPEHTIPLPKGVGHVPRRASHRGAEEPRRLRYSYRRRPITTARPTSRRPGRGPA